MCQACTVAGFRAGGKGAALRRPERQTGRQDSPRAASADGRAPSSNGGSSSSSAGLRVISPVGPGAGARSPGAGLDAARGSGLRAQALETRVVAAEPGSGPHRRRAPGRGSEAGRR